ncbi:MAG TPA: chemotaxis protein CheW [Polyangia bacterium]|nr:chemotaxis protein CheW [Polyangia bacterium]
MSERVIALRHAFDEAFRRAAHELADDRARLLRLRVGGDAYAFRLDEIASFAAARRIVPLASAVPGLLGLAGLRGTLVPVYSLAALLGRAADDEAPRWFVLCGGAEPVALAFARFEGYVETARGELRGSVVQLDRRPHTLISIPTLLASMSASLVSAGPQER